MIKYIIFIAIMFISSSVFALYDQPYIEYDEEGITQVNCMRCNDVIKKRMLVRHVLHDGNEIYVTQIKTLSNIANISFKLNDDSYVNLLFCKRCENEYNSDKSEIDGMTAQLKSGFEIEMDIAKRPEEEKARMREKIKNIKVKKQGKKEKNR